MTLEQLYEARLDSLRSINYYGEFDCFCETVFFSLCDGDTGESLKSYEVSFDEDTGEVDYDVEFTSEYDSGYCNFKRLPKSVQAHVLAIVEAYMKEQAEENALFEESEETTEMEASEEVEEVEETTEMGTLQVVENREVNKMTLAQQFNDFSKSKCSMDELISFRDQYVVSTGVCRTGGSFSYSMIFTDCSVWGYSRIYRYDTELDNFGYNTVTEHETFYWQ